MFPFLWTDSFFVKVIYFSQIFIMEQSINDNISQGWATLFTFTGHIRDKLRMHGLAIKQGLKRTKYSDFMVTFMIKQISNVTIVLKLQNYLLLKSVTMSKLAQIYPYTKPARQILLYI